MAEFTPGPWRVMRFDEGASWGVSAEDRVIGTMHGGRTGEANARLIASAPQLLFSIKQFLDAIDGSIDELSIEAFNAYGQCVEAIALAEGREP